MPELIVCRRTCVCPSPQMNLHFHPGGPLCLTLSVPGM